MLTFKERGLKGMKKYIEEGIMPLAKYAAIILGGLFFAHKQRK